MTDTESGKENPFDNLREALYELSRAHDDVTDAEEHLNKQRKKFNGKRIDMRLIYTQAELAAKSLGEELPKVFMDGQILVEFDGDHNATVKHVPHMESYRILNLAERFKAK